MTGQISLTEYTQDRDNVTFKLCSQCVCDACLYRASERCPHGKCYDDYRAETDPYDAAHPDKPLRTGWSNWDKPGEQEHWCRGGIFYPISYCPHFVMYQGQQVEDCLDAVVSVFQDGYISCNLVDSVGCTECYRRFEERMDKNEKID